MDSKPASRCAGAAFDSQRLLLAIADLPVPSRYLVGFSGGADSTALLLALHESAERLPAPLSALHFHHGLQPEADEWLAHCRDFCAERGIPFEHERLDVDASGRVSPEEAARDCRYRAVARRLGLDEMYLTAHQAQDQAETLFLNLMRGSGVQGLAGIPALRRLDRGWVARPLLDVQREDLLAYLRDRGVDWLTDPSNADTRFDRNFLRQTLFPQLERRWPGLATRLTRAARNARIAADAMASLIERHHGELLRDELTLPLPGLLALEPDLQSLVLRQWLRRHEVPALPERRLLELLGQLKSADPESRTEVRWAGRALRRYRDQLWLQAGDGGPTCLDKAWSSGPELALGPAAGRIVLQGRAARIPSGWRVRPRRAGDRIRPGPGAPSRPLKQLLQDAGAPPWLRPGIPVLQWEDEAVALGDWVLAPRLRDWLQGHGLEYLWLPNDPGLERIRRTNHSGTITP